MFLIFYNILYKITYIGNQMFSPLMNSAIQTKSDHLYSLATSSTSDPADSLPQEVIAQIFSYLNDLNLRQVNKQWQQNFDAHIYHTILKELPKLLLGNSNIKELATEKLAVEAIFKKQKEKLINLMGQKKAQLVWNCLPKDLRQKFIQLDECMKAYNFYLFYQAIDPQINIAFETADSLIEAVQRLRRQFSSRGLANIKQLNLSSKQLIELPAEVGQLINLEKLNLYNNQLISLSAEIGQLINLKSLDLNNNQLISLSAEIGQLINLKSLDLNNNQLISLSTEIGQLINLTWLNLNYNKLISLPAEIGQLIKLEWLYLQGNQLTSLSPEIGQLIKLEWLYLQSNQLTTLPAEIGQLIKLKWLGLKGNQLTSLSAEIGKLIKLERLDLNNNQLISLSAEIGQLTKLERLDLQGNQLTSLSAEIGQLTKLERLDLQGNQLTSLPTTFKSLKCEINID